MAIKSIREIDITGKRVFCRVDFNVPLDSSGTVKDDTRIRRAIPTIQYAMQQGAKLVLASHLGRPKGERKLEMSLAPVARRLGELLGTPVDFVDDCIGDAVKSAVESLPNGGVILLENLRFHGGETKNDPAFVKELAANADVYINDAFGTAHRAHASTVGVAEAVKDKGAGFLMKEELDNLERALRDPAKPVVAVFGGAKVSDKLGVLQNILDKMDAALIGGGMANTFLKAMGFNVGMSKVEDDMLETAKSIVEASKLKRCRIVLPVDVVTAQKMEETASTRTVPVSAIPSDEMALDIGPETCTAFEQEIASAGTIVWNGPMGVFEMKPFSAGTMRIAHAVAAAKGFSLVGGGDSIRAVSQAGISDKISYISTGGGAFMEFMEGRTLPGVAALEV